MTSTLANTKLSTPAPPNSMPPPLPASTVSLPGLPATNVDAVGVAAGPPDTVGVTVVVGANATSVASGRRRSPSTRLMYIRSLASAAAVRSCRPSTWPSSCVTVVSRSRWPAAALAGSANRSVPATAWRNSKLSFGVGSKNQPWPAPSMSIVTCAGANSWPI